MRLLLLLATLALSACASIPPPAPSRPPVILISIDGGRTDYLDRGVTPTLSALAAQGARGSLKPAFPVKTFPNHYALVTGLNPDRNGIVANNMEDPAIPGVTFKMSNQAAVTDRRWWDQAEPLWVTVERAGIRTATLFWPGSEAAIRGVRPTYMRAYDEAVTNTQRVDELLAWLDAPRRPGFLTLYFEQVDTAGHDHGPDAPEVDVALADVDAAVGRLVAGLKARGLAANIVVVADHGMAEVDPARRIHLDDLIPPDAGRTLDMGPLLTLYPAPGREAEVQRALVKRHPHMECWRKGELPARFRYGRNPRAAPIICVPEVGWSITTGAWVAKQTKIGRGEHGFDPAAPTMAAMFVANGPAFRKGVALPQIDTVDVYPLLAELVGVEPVAGEWDKDADAALAK